MKILKIKVKYILKDRENIIEAEVPYILGSTQRLPDIEPFNQNIYFGPDDGAFLGSICIEENGNINYLSDIIKLNEKGEAKYSPTRSGKYEFSFALIDSE